MKTQICTIAAIVSTGIMAGIFFTWSNAVTPGIGKLDDYAYLAALKSMNRTILNPLFMLLFLLPAFAIPATGILSYTPTGKLQVYIVLAAGLLYITGCLCITIAGNVPLNERLDHTTLGILSAEELKALRTAIESKWNGFNFIRTIASLLSFLLLIVHVLFNK